MPFRLPKNYLRGVSSSIPQSLDTKALQAYIIIFVVVQIVIMHVIQPIYALKGDGNPDDYFVLYERS